MANHLFRTVPHKFTTWVYLIILALLLPLLMIGVYDTTVLLTRALGQPANIVVSVKSLLEPVDTNFYHCFAQGGEESGDMIAPIIPQVAALKPKFIRLDHLFDHYDVVGKNGSELSFNFSRLDGAVNSILATGAKPILALSYMPGVIAKDGTITNVPNDWNDWSGVVKATIEHYSGHTGKNLTGIYYEVWNEPDLDNFGKWGLTGDKNYLTLYHYAALGAGQAQNVNPFYLGGPTTTSLSQNWITALVTSGDRLNFLSWHSYLQDPAQFTQDEHDLITWLLPYPNYILLPKLITEYGLTGGKSKLYSTTYAAAYEAAVFRQLISGGPSYLCTFQLKDGPGQEDSSGWGIITHESNGKQPKPRYFTTNFFDLMAGNRVQLTGEGSWVTGFASTKNNVLRVLLVNFDANGSHVETVPVTFNGLDNPTYTLRNRFLFGTDTSVKISVTDQTYTTKVYMPAQSILILELTK